MLKVYYMLTKPGIIFGNIVTTAAGFILASQGNINYTLFFLTLLGLAFVIASAGIFNNYIDRVADAKMARTKDRALARGLISQQNAIALACLCGLIGIAILSVFTNILTVAVTLIGFFVYLVLYSFWKYRSYYGTFVGSIAGAVPPVVGYCSASNRFDLGAILLFLILMMWQMPHFFSIAMYRLSDYAKDGIPVLPVTKGMHTTKVHMLFYIPAFTLAALMLTLTGYAGPYYMVSVLLLGAAWFVLCLLGLNTQNEHAWARRMFLFSLVVIMGLCFTLSSDVIISG
jgi:protoheme IX farnesyltransferase